MTFLPCRALSLHQPWATLMAVRAKHNETRGWTTSYRGRLLIHATKAPPNAEAMRSRVVRDVLEAHGYTCTDDLPLGVVVARAELAAVGSIELDGPTPIVRCGTQVLEVNPLELAFGCYELGRFAWLMAGLEPLPCPIDATGRQGLWVPSPILAAQCWGDSGSFTVDGSTNLLPKGIIR